MVQNSNTKIKVQIQYYKKHSNILIRFIIASSFVAFSWMDEVRVIQNLQLLPVLHKFCSRRSWPDEIRHSYTWNRRRYTCLLITSSLVPLINFNQHVMPSNETASNQNIVSATEKIFENCLRTEEEIKD